jgi:hypothetical protein
MSCRPATPESLDSLRELQQAAAQRGDRCLATLLAGVELYVRAGREMELLDLIAERRGDARRGRRHSHGGRAAAVIRRLVS